MKRRRPLAPRGEPRSGRVYRWLQAMENAWRAPHRPSSENARKGPWSAGRVRGFARPPFMRGRTAVLILAASSSSTPSARHEAHLPAKEAQARTHAWLPRTHAHACGPAHPEAQAREGSPPPHALDGRPARAARPHGTPPKHRPCASVAKRRLRPRIPGWSFLREPLPRRSRVSEDTRRSKPTGAVGRPPGGRRG